MNPRDRSFGSHAIGLCCGLAMLLCSTSSAAWGFTAHFIITRAAIDALPPQLESFYRPHAEFVSGHSIDPDKWRWEDLDWRTVCAPERGPAVLSGDERPRHFLDADAVAPYPFSEIPRDFDRYREQAGDDWEELGSAPWTVEVYALLLQQTMAAAEPDLPTLLCRSSILAHYVADLSQPFHLTVNYDGQLSGLPGIHSRFERHLVEQYDEVLAARILHAAPQARILADPINAAFEMLVDGYPAVHALLRADLLAQRDAMVEDPSAAGDNPAYIRELWKSSGDVAVERLAYGAEMVASFWLSAWDAAGRPDLSALTGDSE